MRPPRYRFPDEVRSATRAMAARMASDGTAPDTPEALDSWIAAHPEVREPLVRGGYGAEFTAEDLFPLLQVFLGPAARPAPGAGAPSSAPDRRWLVPALIGAALIAVVIVLLL
jgi:ferric-dicitrate binding protein FerR (iron transport regulator)